VEGVVTDKKNRVRVKAIQVKKSSPKSNSRDDEGAGGGRHERKGESAGGSSQVWR